MYTFTYFYYTICKGITIKLKEFIMSIVNNNFRLFYISTNQKRKISPIQKEGINKTQNMKKIICNYFFVICNKCLHH